MFAQRIMQVSISLFAVLSSLVDAAPDSCKADGCEPPALVLAQVDKGLTQKITDGHSASVTISEHGRIDPVVEANHDMSKSTQEVDSGDVVEPKLISGFASKHDQEFFEGLVVCASKEEEVISTELKKMEGTVKSSFLTNENMRQIWHDLEATGLNSTLLQETVIEIGKNYLFGNFFGREGMALFLWEKGWSKEQIEILAKQVVQLEQVGLSWLAFYQETFGDQMSLLIRLQKRMGTFHTFDAKKAEKKLREKQPGLDEAIEAKIDLVLEKIREDGAEKSMTISVWVALAMWAAYMWPGH